MPSRRDVLGPARPSTANKKKRAAKAPTAQGISEVKRPSSALTFSSAPPDKTKQSKLGFDTQPAAKKKKTEQPAASALSKGKQREQSPSDDEVARSSLASARSSLWSAKYAPSERSQLAVHPRKVSDVESWLRDAYSGKAAMARYRRLLILTGPAGSGKTETLRQLSRAEELDFDIVEWKSEESGLVTSDDFGESQRLRHSANMNNQLIATCAVHYDAHQKHKVSWRNFANLCQRQQGSTHSV